MKLGKWSAAAVLGVLGTLVACSGATSSAGGQYDSCLSSQLGSACISCVRTNCPSVLSTLETGCNDLLACVCPGGDFSAANAMSQICLSKASEASCVAAESPDGGSSCTACDSTCAASDSTGGPDGGTSNSGSSSGGSSGFSSSSSGGNHSGGSSSSSGGSNACAGTLLPGTAAVSLTLTGVDLGDMNGASDWETVGDNLDGKCTTASSTDVCTLSAGAPLSAQDDGTNGIDNSFGENICPIFDSLMSGGVCSTLVTAAYLQTDATGSGSLVIPFGTYNVTYPVQDVHVSMTGSGGVVGGVMPTAGFIAAWQAVAGCISTSLCSGSAFQAIAQQFQQASDIGAAGTDDQGTTCNGVSFGLRFTGSSPLSGLPMSQSCACQ